MKTNNLKWIALTLAALLLFQSCKVYHSKTVPVDEVILSKERVRVLLNSDVTYDFDQLKREKGLLFGITKSKSGTAEKLSDDGVEGEIYGKNLKILLAEETVKEYRLQNKDLSTIISIALPVIIIGGGLTLIVINGLNNMSVGL